jgi:type II secretory pathway pseudopilin PulG
MARISRHAAGVGDRPRQQGATLIEVLVAGLLLAVALLGLAGAQIRAVAEVRYAQQIFLAATAADDLVARWRARGRERVPAARVDRWRAGLADQLPGARASVRWPTPDRMGQIEIRWADALGPPYRRSFGP